MVALATQLEKPRISDFFVDLAPQKATVARKSRPYKGFSVCALDGAEGKTVDAYGHTGRRHDEGTGLQYFRARYYDAILGRFASRDPLNYVDGMTLYAGYFVPNSTDPLGLLEICCASWEKRYNLNGVTLVDCIDQRVRDVDGGLVSTLEAVAIATGIFTAGRIQNLVAAIRMHMGSTAGVSLLALMARAATSIGNAGTWCLDLGCTDMTTLRTRCVRSNWWPFRWYVETYCPSGYTRAEVNHSDGYWWKIP